MNDGVIWTSRPCHWPDFDWDSVSAIEVLSADFKSRLTGRERCDHATREEAERHYHDDRVARVRFEPFDPETARERRRCDAEGCVFWEDFAAYWPGGYEVDHVCEPHKSRFAEIHPFVPGIEVIHS